MTDAPETTAPKATRLSVFPLPGALLFPGMHLPLHIFEPRYRAMISDSMARDRRIGMIQPRPGPLTPGEAPALFTIGCVGRIAESRHARDVSGQVGPVHQEPVRALCEPREAAHYLLLEDLAGEERDHAHE